MKRFAAVAARSSTPSMCSQRSERAKSSFCQAKRVEIFHSGRVPLPGVPSPIEPTWLSLIGLPGREMNCWFSYQVAVLVNWN